MSFFSIFIVFIRSIPISIKLVTIDFVALFCVVLRCVVSCRLFEYYRGKNNQGLKINMTAPVLVAPGEGGYKVHFYLPKQYQTFAPTPLNPDIRLANLPGKAHQYAAVRRFDGLITDETIPANLEPLKKSLQSSREYARAVNGGVTMLAAYNRPSQLTDRVNELFIWFN